MLEKLFGSKTAERVLMYLFVFQEGYPEALKDFHILKARGVIVD